jgi:Zn-dependent protease with chaperone function
MTTPLLVHNRIEKNHRSTIILLTLVPLLLLPFAASLALWLAPWVLIEGMMVHRPIVESWLGTSLESWFGSDPFWAELRLVVIAAAIVVTIMTVVTLLAALLYRYVILGTTDAKLLRPGQEPDLRRLVENLCIGVGLPPPRLYLIESAVPNAFATGRDPAHATLTVTRGLLTLLTRRELEGVVAHELAHIVNHDSRLNTAVAALIATLRLPIGIVSGAYRILREAHAGLGILFLVGFFGFLGLLGVAMVDFFVDPETAQLPRWIIWRQVFVALSPFFMFLGAPALGLFIRQAVARQREYLADAEAVLLMRDPEGLALALTKIGAWRGPGRLAVGPSASHLCIVDPLRPDSPWWDRMFPCHPAIHDRVQLLARMGTGIAESALQAAAAEGANAGHRATVLSQPAQRERSAPRAGGNRFLGAILAPSRRAVWRQIASDIGAEYQDDGLFRPGVLRYRSSDWEITLDTCTDGGGDSSTTYTRMRAPFVNKDVLALKIYRAGLFAPMGTFFGIQDIETGDSSFDGHFVIQGNNRTKIRWLLGDATLKELIQVQPDLYLEIRHDDGTWDDKDLLMFKCRGVLKDETLLKKLFDLFCTTLAKLTQMDSSSGQAIPPHLTPVYEQADGWSQVLCQLPDQAAVTVCGTEGNFLKVTTADRVVGYISQSARDRVIATPGN